MNKRQIYFAKQKLLGVLLVVIAVVAAILLDGDITASLFIGIPGLYFMFTKKMYLEDEYKFEREEME